jgi:hypothetical protein
MQMCTLLQTSYRQEQLPFVSDSDLQALDSFLLDQSYIHAWTLTDYDLVLFQHLSRTKSSPPPNLVNLCRWFNHVRTLVLQDSDYKKRDCQRRKVTVEDVATLLLGRIKVEDDLDKKVRRVLQC